MFIDGFYGLVLFGFFLGIRVVGVGGIRFLSGCKIFIILGLF